jgi:hypothetical protein
MGDVLCGIETKPAAIDACDAQKPESARKSCFVLAGKSLTIYDHGGKYEAAAKVAD